MTRLFASVVVGADHELIHECVASLVRSAGRYAVDVQVTVNRPGSHLLPNLKQLEARFPEVRIYVDDERSGFPTNHNRALRGKSAEYLLVANDDLVFQDRAVEKALDELERQENARVAAMSPRLRNGDGSLQRSTYGFPTVPRALLDLSGLRSIIPHNRFTDFAARHVGRDEGRSRFWAHDRAVDVETFRGAAMFIRTSAWREVGEFCEIARVGGEIADWHRRCRDIGWRVRYFPDCDVTHFGSRTVSGDKLLQNEYLKGYILYFDRHARPSALAIFRAAGIVVASARLVIAEISGNAVAAKLWRMNMSVLRSSAWMQG